MFFLSFHTPSFVSRTEKKEVTSSQKLLPKPIKKPVLTTIPVYTRGIYEKPIAVHCHRRIAMYKMHLSVKMAFFSLLLLFPLHYSDNHRSMIKQA